MTTPLHDVSTTVPKSFVANPQQTRSPTLSFLDSSPVIGLRPHNPSLLMKRHPDGLGQLLHQKWLLQHGAVTILFRHSCCAIPAGEDEWYMAVVQDFGDRLDPLATHINVKYGDAEVGCLCDFRGLGDVACFGTTWWPSSSTISAIIIRMMASSSTNSTDRRWALASVNRRSL